MLDTKLPEEEMSAYVKPIIMGIAKSLPSGWDELFLGYVLVDIGPNTDPLNIITVGEEAYDGTFLFEIKASPEKTSSVKKEVIVPLMLESQRKFGELYRAARKSGDNWRRLYLTVGNDGRVQMAVDNTPVHDLSEITGENAL